MASLFPQHEHNEECGHDEATHKRIADKMNHFMEEVAEDLFTEKDLANLYLIIKAKLREDGAGTGLPYLKAFNQGFEFGIYASQNNGTDSIQLIAGMRRISKLKQEDIKKLAEKKMQDNNTDNESD